VNARGGTGNGIKEHDMRIHITGRKMEVSDALKSYAEEKLQKVKRHLRSTLNAHVILSVDKHRHIAEVTVHANGIDFHGVEETQDMYSSIDKVMDKIDRQARKYKGKKRTGKKREGTPSRTGEAESVEEEKEEPSSPPPRRKRLSPPASVNGGPEVYREVRQARPLTLEEAKSELDSLEYRFLVYRNPSNEKINVLYRRNDGTLGLIDPE
jgi:putative sigma-54 modulation protein